MENSIFCAVNIATTTQVLMLIIFIYLFFCILYYRLIMKERDDACRYNETFL